MDILEAEIGKLIRQKRLLTGGEKILVGVSGGADSVCLLGVLCALAGEFSLRLMVGHVHHGLRTAADDDEAFVRELAAARGLPCHIEHVDVPSLKKQWKCSTEEAARRARYEALAGAAERFGADLLAVAHHMEDQAETVLLNLFRGAGLRGASGMEITRASAVLESGKILPPLIRPLLGVTRGEIEDYLSRNGLDHREDESNRQDCFARNCIRHRILPVAEEMIHPGATAHLAQTAEYMREALTFIEGEALERFRRIRTEDGALDVRGLSGEEQFMQTQILITALREAGILRGISKAHISALCGLCENDRGSERVDLPGGYYAERVYGKLYIRKESTDAVQHNSTEIRVDLTAAEETQRILLPGAGAVELTVRAAKHATDKTEIPRDPYTKWFDCDKIGASLVFRRRRPGDSIHVGNGRKPLAREMLDQKIPSADRDGYWLMARDSEILWIIGNRRSQEALVGEETVRILECVWRPQEKTPENDTQT